MVAPLNTSGFLNSAKALLCHPSQVMSQEIFKPRNIESRSTYKALGVEFVKRWIPFNGSSWKRSIRRFREVPKSIESDNLASVEKYELLTRDYEAIHYLAFAAQGALALGLLACQNTDAAVFAVVLQIPFNVYPIMLQRYNRLGLMELQEKLSQDS